MPSKTIFTNAELDRMIRTPDMAYDDLTLEEEINRWEEGLSMAPDRRRIQQYLKSFDFRTLFIEELGWDNLREAPLAISVDGQTYTLRSLMEKRGFKVYTCSPDAKGQVPGNATMHKIEREVTRHAYEHIIIYIDAAQENQAWQWIKREPSKPSASRLYRLHSNQSGELLSQKLLALAFSIEEEAQLGTTVVAARVRQALDAERVTKKFYDRFQKEHASFLTFIEGISAQADREWYASLMLNRLMFVYFIQKKGLLATSEREQLDGDHDYLSHKLKAMQAQYGSDQFYSFYRYFLLRLFHEGLSSRERSMELDQLLGNVPYLNGGLFDVHVLERDYPDIQIADEAFERIFAFFDEYQWHLDDRPLRNDREINPDVLGYIFEKYINQKQMGAYYTKEDITEYIGKSTIIPYFLEAAEQKCLIAFAPDGPIWALLRDDPDRYIYEAVKKGCDLPLPPEIAVGIHEVSQRTEWNKAALSEYALPTEIWREVVARRTRYEEVRAKLANGEIIAINDLITYNLDMRQFAEDAITYSEGVDLLNAFYESLEQVTVLDPTCGSGAFLFAALNILEPLYEACLDRMQEMVAERDRLDTADAKRRLQRPGSYFPHFRDILAQVARHPNRRYFMLKSIIINNLYGVDIMEEASEICKLRLFLKLVAQIERFEDIEPLPDIDFNIRAGNTLVGFTTQEEVGRAIARDLRSAMTSADAVASIEQKAKEVERDFDNFRKLQTQLQLDSTDMAENKEHIREKLHILRVELDCYLAAEYGIDESNITKKEAYDEKFEQWRQSHQPFHWFVEFYGIMKNGGFDVIIGNPPYVEYSKVRKNYTVQGYQTVICGNLYSLIMERTLKLVIRDGRCGLIVPVSLLCTERMISLQKILFRAGQSWYSSFDTRPSPLFTGVTQRLTIINLYASRSDRQTLFFGGYRRWDEEERDTLQAVTTYTSISSNEFELGYIPKAARDMESSIVKKLRTHALTLSHFEIEPNEHPIYVHRIIRYFIKAIDFVPYFWNESEGQKKSEDYKPFFFKSDVLYAIAATLNSSLFYWFWHVYSDGFHCGYRDVRAFPIGSLQKFQDLPKLQSLGRRLMNELHQSTTRRTVISKSTGRVEYDEFNPRLCLPTIWEIDRILAKYYEFTQEELDFIINYDIKYRMGRGDNEEGDEE